MSGIIGIAQESEEKLVGKGLSQIMHRGAKAALHSYRGATFGRVWPETQATYAMSAAAYPVALDGEIYNWSDLSAGSTCPLEAIVSAYQRQGSSFVSSLDGPFALAIAGEDGLFLARDLVGKAPLYLGWRNGTICFGSEVKSLLGWADKIEEFPPGCYYRPGSGIVAYADLRLRSPLDSTPEDIAAQLRDRLVASVRKRMNGDVMGVWLSGGLDSATMAALACCQLPKVRTFSAGMDGATDLVYARALAEYLGTEHRECVCTLEEMLAALPEVIRCLESFDVLLVRSSVMNFLVGKLASEHVPAVLSGEGGDELFAGYDYLKQLSTEEIPGELVDITKRLHNTALQRVDRCSAGHGLVARTGLLDRDVLDYALRIPADLKLHENGRTTEKWILRVAMDGLLPEEILWRPKSKFWEGSGVGECLHSHAEGVISDEEFTRERMLDGAKQLASKEELFYYRIFREHFGEAVSPALVGRTKGVSVS